MHVPTRSAHAGSQSLGRFMSPSPQRKQAFGYPSVWLAPMHAVPALDDDEPTGGSVFNR
jgi:hypothetical protein